MIVPIMRHVTCSVCGNSKYFSIYIDRIVIMDKNGGLSFNGDEEFQDDEYYYIDTETQFQYTMEEIIDSLSRNNISYSMTCAICESDQVFYSDGLTKEVDSIRNSVFSNIEKKHELTKERKAYAIQMRGGGDVCSY